MTLHVCPYPTCDRMVPQHQLACRKHWFTVTPDTRQRVWSTWRSPDRAGHALAVSDAVDEMRQHHDQAAP